MYSTKYDVLLYNRLARLLTCLYKNGEEKAIKMWHMKANRSNPGHRSHNR